MPIMKGQDVSICLSPRGWDEREQRDEDEDEDEDEQDHLAS